jgi:hypothetical protein
MEHSSNTHMSKKWLFPFAIGLIIGLNSYSQKNVASMSFDRTINDFGVIKETDGLVSCIFEFVNSGTNPLVIQRVISSCDCATTNWSREPFAPGAKGLIKVIYNPKDRPGKFDKTITVYSNGETSAIVLRIMGIVKEKPKTLEEIYNRILGDFRLKKTNINLSRVYSDMVKTDTLEFICMANQPTKIGCNTGGLEHLSVKFVPEIVKPNEKGIMVITYDAKKKNDWGFLIDRIHLTQNDKDINGGLITITANIEENFSSLTDKQRKNAPVIDVPIVDYDFNQIDEGKLIEYDFMIKNTGKSDLIIRKIKPSCGCTTVEPADKVIKPGMTSSFKATINTNGLFGRISKSIALITNDPVTPTVAFRINGTVNPLKK